jgi:hypothetical protein
MVQAAEMIASGQVHIPVVATYALSSIKEAVAHALRGGKILLDLTGSPKGPRNRHLSVEHSRRTKMVIMVNEISRSLLLAIFCVVLIVIANWAMRPRDHDDDG